MAAFIDLLGNSLLSAGLETRSTEEALAGKGAVALYFSAHWCPPCRGFTPKLAEWYRKDLKSKGLEVVFVSSDKDEAAFKEYFAEQPWLALPYEDRETKDKLSKKFKVQGIPSLVILDSDGKTITLDGREAVSEDSTGEDFPWKPVPVKDLLRQAKLVNASGVVSFEQAMESKKALALYFSAHWCPPCRGFTPKLAEWYNKDLKSKGLEVIFVSSDKDEAAFKEYFAEQPWLALDYSDRKLKQKLSNAFKVKGIPSLVILDSELNTITTEGRGAVSADPEGVELPWYPKPVKNLSNGPGNINEEPTVVVFCETSDPDEQKVLEATLEPLAKKFMEKQKATGEDLEVAFMVATDPSGLAPRLRGMLELPGLPNASEKIEKMAPRMALIDIPSDGAYYLADEGVAITTSAVEDFITNFQAGKLERKQLK